MPCVNHPDRESTARCVTCGAELCDECRVEVGGRNYCAKDAPMEAAPSVTFGAPPIATTPPPVPSPPMIASPGVTDDPSQEQPVLAALAYVVWIVIPIVILCTDMKKSRYMRFHAFNALFLAIACIAIEIALSIIMMIGSAIPGIGFVLGIVGACVSFLIPIGILVLVIILAIKAYNKQELELPVITQMARDQADKMRV
ncbi:MAG: DUF4870 domain-containing protein [Candidatus Zipacnadales bacterium]